MTVSHKRRIRGDAWAGKNPRPDSLSLFHRAAGSLLVGLAVALLSGTPTRVCADPTYSTDTVTAPVITGVGNSNSLKLGLFSSPVSGSGFSRLTTATLNGTPVTAKFSNGKLTISGFYGHEGQSSLVLSNAGVASAPFTVQVGVASPKVSPAAARRFLQQAAFGPTPADADTVQQLGFRAWLNKQYSMAPVSTYSGITSQQDVMPNHFLTDAVSAPDQLRQRVAFALGQIFVTSLQLDQLQGALGFNATMILYQDMLLNDAFSNYRQIMEDVTLSPAMGQYLNMANNAKADPVAGSVANENYGREVMQMFSIGTVMLNQDGSAQLDSHNMPIPAYTQAVVADTARVMTGWTYAPAPGHPVTWNAFVNANGPMVPFEAQHDEGAKTLLNGFSEPAGLTAQQDLDNTLDNIFNHPNVGPFVARQMIQHLVKSNPSPAYISRVAAAFNNNGSGVRGDMKAVISAVLLDQEARANDDGANDQASDGHLQEPALFIAGMVRAFSGTMTDDNIFPADLARLGQDLFNPQSVFNYYLPGYKAPTTTLTGGEFQINTTSAAVIRANEVSDLFFGSGESAVQSYGTGTTVNLRSFVGIAGDAATLVDALDLTLTRGVMPAAMKSAVISAVSAAGTDPILRTQTACYLILTSYYYNVWH